MTWNMKMAKFYNKLNLVFFLWFVGKFCCEATEKKVYDLCMPSNIRVFPQLNDVGYIRVNTRRNLPGSQMQCKIIFNLCPTCRLWLQFNKSTIPTNRKVYPDISSPCFQNCYYIRVVDEIYNSTHAFLFQPLEEFTSVSNRVSVTLCNTSRKDLTFSLIFRVEKKIQRINPVHPITIKSPNFPSGYAVNGEEFIYEIIKPPSYESLMITFTDWIMSPDSKLIVRSPTKVFFGNSSRPVFISQKSIEIIFSTGYKTNYHHSDVVRGFKATIIRDIISKPIPITSCGQNVIQMKYGGILRFSPGGKHSYDCVWVILIHPHFKQVSVQLESFQSLSLPAVKFYEGLTSEGRLLKTVYPYENFVHQNPNGFYIRLEGEMDFGDHFVLTYSSFTSAVKSCPNAFKCKDGVCINLSLKCDGINNCLDKSDETECFKEKSPYQPLTSNWSVSIIIPIVITIFIFIILCLFFIFVRRFRKISRIQVPHRQRRLASVSRNVSQQYLQNHFGRNMSVEETDSPPSYEEVMNSPPPSGNWNLAFNWSQQDLRDTPAPPPPPYSEYMRENEVNIYSSIADNDTSDLSTIPTECSNSNNCTDPISEDQNSISESGSDTLYLENIYSTIYETPTNNLDQWMVDRSTSTSEQEIDMDMENNKVSVDETVIRTQAVQELNTRMPSLRKNVNEDSNLNHSSLTLPGADSIKSNSVLEKSDPAAKDATNHIRYQTQSVNGEILRSNCSRSMDMIPGSDYNFSRDNSHCGKNAVQNPRNKNGSLMRRNSFPSVIFLTDRQLNNEVFV